MKERMNKRLWAMIDEELDNEIEKVRQKMMDRKWDMPITKSRVVRALLRIGLDNIRIE